MNQRNRAKPGVESRRSFLLVAVAGVAGWAALPAGAGGNSPAQKPVTGRAEKRKQGYRETDHVRTYYERARM